MILNPMTETHVSSVVVKLPGLMMYASVNRADLINSNVISIILSILYECKWAYVITQNDRVNVQYR